MGFSVCHLLRWKFIEGIFCGSLSTKLFKETDCQLRKSDCGMLSQKELHTRSNYMRTSLKTNLKYGKTSKIIKLLGYWGWRGIGGGFIISYWIFGGIYDECRVNHAESRLYLWNLTKKSLLYCHGKPEILKVFLRFLNTQKLSRKPLSRGKESIQKIFQPQKKNHPKGKSATKSLKFNYK